MTLATVTERLRERASKGDFLARDALYAINMQKDELERLYALLKENGVDINP